MCRNLFERRDEFQDEYDEKEIQTAIEICSNLADWVYWYRAHVEGRWCGIWRLQHLDEE